MNPRQKWVAVFAGGVLLAGGVGYMIWDQYGKIDIARTEVAGLRTNIDSSRKLIEGTGTLEREVIVLRELSEVMKKILPDTDDVNNLVRTFQKFSEESGVRITGRRDTRPLLERICRSPSNGTCAAMAGPRRRWIGWRTNRT